MVLPDMSWVSHFCSEPFLFLRMASCVISRDDDFSKFGWRLFDLNRGSHISTRVTGEGHMMVLGLTDGIPEDP